MNTSTFWSTRVPRTLRRLSFLLAGIGLGHFAEAQSFLRADGQRIVNASNQEVILNGMNLGNWAVQEGYMMKVNWPGIRIGDKDFKTQGMVKRTLYNAGMSEAAIESFYQSYRNTFITKPDLDYIASKGFNCVRLPLHYELFLTPAQRAVRTKVMLGTVTYESYVSQLTNWYNANQLFTDVNNMEALRMIDNTLSWAQANNMYVVLDMHAVPGSQGTDANIADQIVPNDLWNRQINQDVLDRLWRFVSSRYKNDSRVAMYDLINEPNNYPNNPKIHDVYQRLITSIRGQGDNHLILLEGNGWGNDYNYMEPFTFPNRSNLVYNSHRYSGKDYEMDNGVNSTGGSANNIRFIGDLRNFRSTHNVPIWIGETGENTDTWMGDAARNLNSVGIGWCHWTYKRFENISNPAFMHINPPYVVDGPAGLNQVLTNIQFANCVPNTTVAAVSPSQNGIINYPGGGNYNGTGGSTSSGPAVGRIYEISSKNGGKALEVSASSQANGGRVQQWGWVSAANQKWKLVDAGGGYVRIVNVNSNKSLDVAGPSTADGTLTHQWDWLTQDSQYWKIESNGDGTYRILNKYSGKALDVQNNSTADGAAIQQWAYGGGNNQRWWFSDQGAAARVALATTASAATDARLQVYPTVATSDLNLSYNAPVSQRLSLRLLDLTGRVISSQPDRSVSAGPNLVQLPVAAVRAGIYLLQVDTPEGQLVRRVIVAH